MHSITAQLLVAMLFGILILIMPRVLHYLFPDRGAASRLIPSPQRDARSNFMTNNVQKPHEKMPEHHSTDQQLLTKEEKIDAQGADSFPASDLPSYSGGKHIVGAPTGRESDGPTLDRDAVAHAEKKVKSGAAAKADK